MTSWLNVKNNAESALASAITAAATSLTLVSGEGSKFPASNFHITIDDEIILCSSRIGDVLTVTRAQESTTASAHAAGAIVALNITAGIITQLQEAVDLGGGGGREILTEPRTYYVRTDGNDGNTGLVNSAAGAFKTIQKAIDVAATLDTSIYDVTIQVGNGTYSITSTITCKDCVGAGSVTIVGDEITPSNVVLDGAGIAAIILDNGVHTVYKIRGLKLMSTAGSVTFGINVRNNSYLEYQNMDIGSGFVQQIRPDDGGSIKCTGNYTISGGAVMNHFNITGGILRVQAVTVTLIGTPAFGNFIDAGYLALCLVNGITFSGSATGARYNCYANSVILCGGSPTYFPGNAAGSVATGGQYI